MDDPANISDWQEALYEAQSACLILYGRALGLTHSEAEDVVQDLFQVLLTKPTAPDEPARYLLRAFRNRAIRFKRSFWRRCIAELESQRWFETTPGETDAERAAMRCLARLNRDQREVIVLKHWHQLTFEQIGELLEISPHTAAGRYRYGLQHLRRHLDPKVSSPITSVREAAPFDPFDPSGKSLPNHETYGTDIQNSCLETQIPIARP